MKLNDKVYEVYLRYLKVCSVDLWGLEVGSQVELVSFTGLNYVKSPTVTFLGVSEQEEIYSSDKVVFYATEMDLGPYWWEGRQFDIILEWTLSEYKESWFCTLKSEEKILPEPEKLKNALAQLPDSKIITKLKYQR